ncbi:hypothetical protein MN116_008818 [Schistosoma mekongi]|uniref:Uncharacterized protein n=1 Tax=Schistosoma mekongi TaxID=38744 RepID=A0AAE1Z5N7_SCHME|nr:hypothetical protein MN116_008818 [Schistosoma mekongi]
MVDSGDHRHFDMLLRDIYGGAYDAPGLSGDVIASSFGLAARHPEQPRGLADMVKSLSVTARPWLADDYDIWIDRISVSESPYRCVLIFCNNSGADIILGVLPFAMEFLRHGSKVIMDSEILFYDLS